MSPRLRPARRPHGGRTQQDAGFVLDLPANCAPDEALRRVLDLRVHDRVIPFTRVRPAVSADELGPGSVFVGRTGWGPLAFDDVMRVDELLLAVPARARITKQGRALRGQVLVDATALPATDASPGSGSRVRWEQRVHLPWLPAVVQPLAARVLAVGYRRVLTRLLHTSS